MIREMMTPRLPDHGVAYNTPVNRAMQSCSRIWTSTKKTPLLQLASSCDRRHTRPQSTG